MLRCAALAACAAALAGCASQPPVSLGKAGAGRYFDPLLGVWASPRVVEDGQAVPRGGGGYLIGRPYTIGGRVYAPIADPRGYSSVGTASWYGDAFHGRRTANGEVFDKGSISAAHPTLPLPSYVRVTNLNNGRSMIVRVNDRGPYHGGRVMDVSQRVAEALAFKNQGTGRIRIDYVGRASLVGSDDERLIATLTTDGRPAHLEGMAEPPAVADEALPPVPDGPSPLPNVPARVAALPIFQPERPLPPPKPDPVPAAPSPPPRALAAARPTARGIRTAGGGDPFFRPLPEGPKHRSPADPSRPPGTRAAAPPRRPSHSDQDGDGR